MYKNSKLCVEIHGANGHNCGAEMMAIAVAEQLRSRYPEVVICVPPDYGDSTERDRHGFILVPEFTSWPQRKILSACDRWTPPMVVRVVRQMDFVFQRLVAWFKDRKSGRTVSPLDVDCVIDASGFAFSDQWGRHKAQNLLEKMTYRRGRIPLILLPQAMGPFELGHVAKACKSLLSRADLVFVRDRFSQQKVQALTSGRVNSQLFPDFTISLGAKCDDAQRVTGPYAAVVPNYRMIDKGGEASAYLDFLERAVGLIESIGVAPVLLLHESREDWRLVEMLAERGVSPQVLRDPDPLVLKRYLGNAEFVIGSRFHALVSALSQGVPTIGAGWSHKYQELSAEFCVPEFVITDIRDKQHLESLVARVSNAEQRRQLSEVISKAAASKKIKIGLMWKQVFDLFDQRLGKCGIPRRSTCG
jgi:polysaccharide pyruvyl transferase WcaK-like protein